MQVLSKKHHTHPPTHTHTHTHKEDEPNFFFGFLSPPPPLRQAYTHTCVRVGGVTNQKSDRELNEKALPHFCFQFFRMAQERKKKKTKQKWTRSSMTIAVRGRGWREFGSSVFAEFRLSGRSGMAVLPVGLHVNGSSGCFVIRVSSGGGFGATERSSANGAQMMTDDDAVGRAESHDSGRMIAHSGGFQVAYLSVVKQSDFGCGSGSGGGSGCGK